MDDGRTPSQEEQNLADLAAAFENHQITDDEGKLAEDTATDDSAYQEQNTEKETAPAEKPLNEESVSQDDETSDETNYAVDDSGKRYIPEKRLKKETAKRREAERERDALKALAASQQMGVNPGQRQPEQSSSADDVETEVLFSKYPQFDPNGSEYSKALDTLGYQILKANPNLSRLKAARLAIEKAREITSDSAKILAEARTVKAQQSDQGITSRVVSRGSTQVNPDKMSLSEKEEWLKANGLW